MAPPKRRFCTYLFFASSLVGLSSQLERIRAFGEKALSDAFTREFQHLTCFIHVRKNLKDKLSECSVPSSSSLTISSEKGKVVEGIVDADFQSKLEIAYDLR